MCVRKYSPSPSAPNLTSFQYLYYSSKLANADTIREIVVWEQGRGIINNIGAMRSKNLTDWGVYEGGDSRDVYQWDGETLSPVVHQWDRDHDLHAFIYGKEYKRLRDQWAARTAQ